ncbi:MAG TPA: YdeI/OmpD-associated family protein [Chthoniobacterales bacterium]|nr:YdeI/OmpD-associated family protein [Chthoniobacterales bacterium]
MEVGTTLYVTTRKAWRAWLQKNHAKQKEIWLVYTKKQSGKARIPYDVAVEEALCFGWIDGIMKSIDADYFVQRFSPRRSAKSQLSETNKERVRRMIRAGLMTPAGMEKIRGRMSEKFVPAPDIIAALKRDPVAWKNFQRFPKWYQRVRLGWLDMSRHRQDIFESRLRYFLKMTALNKRYGQVNEAVTRERRFTNRRASL